MHKELNRSFISFFYSEDLLPHKI